MKNTKKVIYSITLLLLALPLVLFVGCGDDNTVPFDGSIVFEPSSLNFSIGSDTCFNSAVKVLFNDDTPMSGAVVTMSGNFAWPRQGAGSRYSFYSGPCTYPIDPAKLQDGNGFTGVTDDAGMYHYAVVVSAASGTFTDIINAYSGAVYNSQDIALE